MSTDAWRRGVMIGGGVAVVGIVVTGVVMVWPSESSPSSVGSDRPRPTTTSSANAATDVAQKFMTAFSAGDAAAAGALTDDPPAATKALIDLRSGFGSATLSASLTQPLTSTQGGATASAPTRLSWSLGSAGTWTYDSTIELAKAGERWSVHWMPALIHPKLTPGRTLVLLGGQAGQAALQDRDNKPLLTWEANGLQASDATLAPQLMPTLRKVVGQQGGAEGQRVAIVDAIGKELEVLHGKLAAPTKPITTTLSSTIQKAAQIAVDSVAQGAMLVAIDSSGEIMAVAQNGAATASPLTGQFPPGSTFKVATVAAALQTGKVGIDTQLPCPGVDTIAGRTIPNFERFDLGTTPLRRAFSMSCNTTFGRLASELPPEGLSNAATQLGFNADFDIPGLQTEAGNVEPASAANQRVEDGIGQGRVQASTFGVALMAATVASGKAVTPTLWREPNLQTKINQGYQASLAQVIAQLRTMMREVVTNGRATALGRYGTVYGKTGTAEYTNAGASHGWFAGYRGRVAFAVIVVGAERSSLAVNVSGKFLSGFRS